MSGLVVLGRTVFDYSLTGFSVLVMSIVCRSLLRLVESCVPGLCR